jgi:hypothetical protein
MRKRYSSKKKQLYEWRKIYNEQIHTLHCSLNNITMAESRSGPMRWVRCVAGINGKKYIKLQLKNLIAICHVGDVEN